MSKQSNDSINNIKQNECANIKQNECANIYLNGSEDSPEEENINELFTSSNSNSDSDSGSNTNSNFSNPNKKVNTITKRSNTYKISKQPILNTTNGVYIGNQINDTLEDEKNDIWNSINNADNQDSPEGENINELFTSSDSDYEYDSRDTNKKVNTITKHLNIDKTSKQPVLNTTNGINMGNRITNKLEDEIRNSMNNDANETSSDTKSSNDEESNKDIKSNNANKANKSNDANKANIRHHKNKHINVTNTCHHIVQHDINVNGWDYDANITITNWYNLFKEQSFIYQWVLDRNLKISNRLNTLSVITSSALGIFSGFQIWINDCNTFQTYSSIAVMILNFIVALSTSVSIKYLDNKKNDDIRLYIESTDTFLGEISAQVLKSPVYRTEADKFFELNNDTYTRLVSSAPNLSISEISQGKKEYKKYSIECSNECSNV